MHSHHAPLRLTMLCAALAAAIPAQAQVAALVVKPAKPAEKEVVQVEVKGSASSYDARRDDTASKIVLNHDEIVKYGDTNVLDVLKRLPGVTVAGASGRGGEVRMRGLGSGYTQVLVNGERAPAGFSIDSLAPDAIERIEVIRAATAELSTQSIAGTINIVLKKSISKAQRELKAGLGVGDGTVNPSVNLQMSDRRGQLSYSLSFNAVHNTYKRAIPSFDEGYSLAGVPFLYRETASNDNGAFEAINLGPRVNWTFANGDTLTSQSFINAARFQRESQAKSVTAIGAEPMYPFNTSEMVNENVFFRTDLNWVKKLGGSAKLDTKIGALVGSLRNDYTRLGYLAENGRQVLDSFVKSRGTDQGLSTTGKYTTPLFEGHALAVGWDGGVNRRDDARLQIDAPLVLPGDVLYPRYRAVYRDEVYEGEVSRFAGYAQDEWNVTPRWSVYLGMRWEGIYTTVSGNDFVASKTRSSVVSPLLQTLYKLPGTKGDQVRFAVTRTYKAPNTQSLIPRRFASANNSPTEPDYQGNPNLKPELALGFDTSYEHYWGAGAMVSVSASMRKIDGYTRNGIVLDADGLYVSLPMNDGTATTRGVELEAKFPLKAVLPNAPAIDVRANLSRNWSEVDSVPGPNNRLDAQTPFSGTVGVDYKEGKLTAGASYSFKSGGQVQISEKQGVYGSARRDLELYALWKYDAKNQIRLGVTNVLAQDQINQTTYLEGGRILKSYSVSPGATMFRATAEMKF